MEKYIQDRQPESGKTDYDILQENYKFIREPAEDDLSSWEVRCLLRGWKRSCACGVRVAAVDEVASEVGRCGWPSSTITSYSRSTALRT